MTCPVCHVTFERKNYQQRYCSNACKVKWRTLSGAKRVAHDERACLVCAKPFVARQQNQTFCSDRCRSEHRRLILRQQVIPDRACVGCDRVFTPKQRPQKYCEAKCEQVARNKRSAERGRERAAEARAGRICADCSVSIAHRMRSASRCETCSVIHSNKQYAEKRKANKATTVRQIPPRRDAPKLGPVKEKQEKPSLPNFGGDWFPGWDGCWSPSLSPLAREMAEQYGGPGPTGDPTKKQVAA